ncbi:MAG TPA: lysophospholipid acyltransferase family protein [Chthoniobacterales bacterium]
MLYWFLRLLIQFVLIQTIRIRHANRELAETSGGFVLACSHISHLDPVLVSAILRRKVDWVARIEFFRNPLMARVMHLIDAFPVNRQGVPVSAIKNSIQRIREGKVVGIFPEGEIMQGRESVLRGGPLKRGFALIAQRTNCPVVPCIALGTEKLSTIDPWLPMFRGRVWIQFGKPVHLTPDLPRREQQQRLAADLRDAYQTLYREMLAHFGLEESVLP